MLRITAILHTCNDELRLGRALQTLLPCDEILIFDHGSSDATLRIAHQYGAHVRTAPQPTLRDSSTCARHEWILAMLPSESVSESLEAALFEWKLSPPPDLAGTPAFSISIRQQIAHGWVALPPVVRLVRRTWNRWEGPLPANANHPQAKVLAGELLRFLHP